MTKKEMIDKISGDAGISKVQAGKAIDSMIGAISNTLKDGGKVTFVGFGTFGTSKREARNGINPRTKEPLRIEARTVPTFKAGQRLKSLVK